MRTSIVVIAAGLVLLLAVTVRTTYLDLQLTGWGLLLGGFAGLLIALVAQLRRVPYYSWFGIGPWLTAVGFTGWLALQPPPTPGIDLQMVGFILFVLGVCLSLAALYVVSSFRVGRAMREYWRAPLADDDDPTALRRRSAYDPEPPTKQLPRRP